MLAEIICISSVGIITACGNNDIKHSGKDKSNTLVSKMKKLKQMAFLKKLSK